MKSMWSRCKAPILGSALLLSLAACQNQSNGQTNMQSVPNNQPQTAHHVQDPDLIPSYHGIKTRTTNEHGDTTSEMGTTVYSLIGSSSLHEGGISSHVQSRLASLGIEGIKAFVVNDTIILAQAKSSVSSNQYDDIQRKVLSQMDGLSGKGEPDPGVTGKEASQSDSLSQAKEQVKNMFNEHVQILTVTNPAAPELIDRIATKLHDSARDASISGDIAELLQMTSKEK